jgi:hypothetical protein
MFGKSHRGEDNLGYVFDLLRASFDNGYVAAGVEIGLMLSRVSGRFPAFEKNSQLAFRVFQTIHQASDKGTKNPVVIYGIEPVIR